MNRREFVINSSVGFAASTTLPETILGKVVDDDQLMRYRFGLNYIPSKKWQYCWNDWSPEDIARDLDKIAEVSADHIRIMLIWPWFQPNPIYVSPAHLDRLEDLMRLAHERAIDVLVTLSTGWLSGYAFRPPYLEMVDFFSDPRWRSIRELYFAEVSKRLVLYSNFLGFDLGNEINCCWSCPTSQGDAWMESVFTQVRRLAPDRVHVNGVDHQPWLGVDTFSPQALMAEQDIVALHCWPEWTGASRFGTFMDKPSICLAPAMAALARSYGNAPRKPIWVQEFGLKPNPDVANLSKWLEMAVISGIEGGISWFTWWGSHDINRKFQFGPEQYTRGLITTENEIIEQGYMFKRLADAYRGKSVKIPKLSLPIPPDQRTYKATWKWMLDWMGWKGK